MIQIDDYSEHQLDRATSILIDLFERFTYDYDSMILYYKNSTISELQATVLYYGNIAKTIVDDSIESCEELRKFMENIGVEDTSIIDYIENILRKGGEVIDTAVKITERVNNPDQPTPDVTCSDSSDDYEDWEDEPEVTDEERDTEIEKIAPEPEVIKEMEETKKAEVDPAKVEEARAKQEEADKAAEVAAQARADANEAKAKAEEAKDAYVEAIENLKNASTEGIVVVKDDTVTNTIRGAGDKITDFLTGRDSSKQEDAERKAAQDIINNAIAEGKVAAAEVIAKGGTKEEAEEAFTKEYSKGTMDVRNMDDNKYDWIVSASGLNPENNSLTPVINAIDEAVEARDNAAKAELGAQNAEEVAHAAENAANTAAEEAAEAVEEANNPPCTDCDCDCSDSCDSCDCDCDETPCDSTPCTDDTPPCTDDTCVGDCADEPCVDCADTPCADCADAPCPDTPCADCADCEDCASDTDVCPSDTACDACDE